MATSELASRIATRTLVVNAQGGLDGPYDVALAHVGREADAALAPVREIVELLAHPKFTTDDADKIVYYVTRSDVEAARAVYDSLRVK